MLTENYRNEEDSVSKAPGRREGRPKFYRLITTIEALFFFLFFFLFFKRKPVVITLVKKVQLCIVMFMMSVL